MLAHIHALIIILIPLLSDILTHFLLPWKDSSIPLGHFEHWGLKKKSLWKSLVMLTKSCSALFYISSAWQYIFRQTLNRIWMLFCDLPNLMSFWHDLLKGFYLCGCTLMRWVSGCFLCLKNWSSLWLAEIEWCSKSPLIGWSGVLGVIWVSLNEAISTV